MAEPGIREVSGSIGMAALAGLEHILLEGNALGWIVHLLDIVHPVAVIAHRLVGGSRRISLLKEGDGGAVEIRHVGVHYLGGNAIFLHDAFIGMALAAHLGGRIDLETRRIGALDGMYAVTIGAGWHIRVLVIGNAAAVDAVYVLVVNIVMAARTNFGDGSVFSGSRGTIRIFL